MDLKDGIRRYVLANESAAETVGGVMRAWLKLPSGAFSPATVERALDELVADGFLERHDLPGGVGIYRRAQRELDN